MRAAILAALAAAAIFAGWVTLRVERARVARNNLLGAKALVRTARPIFWHNAGRAFVAIFCAVAVTLACLYLASTGRPS